MKRDYSQFFPLISIAILLLFSVPSYGQAWSGILAPSRAFDWSNAGLPAVLPDGETTANPWTPPVRTQCKTSQCNTVSGGSVTATTISAALNSAPAGTYVLIPSGTFALGGNVSITGNNVTLRGSGASSTKLTGGSIGIGQGSWGGATLLTANPAKGATSVTVASPPTAGRIAALEQCDDGFSASSAAFTHYGSGTVCTGSYRDPLGPWVCGLNTACDFNGGSTPNPHFQMDVFWIPAGGVSKNSVTIGTPLANTNWSTARTAAVVWLNVNGTIGVGVEDLTVVGSIGMNGTYACWVKGVRLITHSLVANSYIANTTEGINYLVEWGYDGGEQGQSHHLFINNIIEGGFAAGEGDQVDEVYAYNYYPTAGNPGWVSNGNFQHHAGTSFLLNEGNQMGKSLDDNTWATHNFNAWFRNYSSCIDPTYPGLDNSPTIGIQGWARFANIIGNALGGGACSSAYQAVYGVFDINNTEYDKTGLTEASTMRWGNYVTCSGNSHCNTSSFDSAEVPTNLSNFGSNSTPYQNPVPSDHNLPASFFMNGMTAHPNGGTGLNWWKTCMRWTSFPTSCASYSAPPMPPIGPDVTGGPNINGHAYDIPAALAWANLPTDSSYATAWGTHLRQFDERVYASDGGGNDPPPTGNLTPPSGLSAVVE
jgi:hypothetical protein